MPENRAAVAGQHFVLLAAVARAAEELGIPWVVTGFRDACRGSLTVLVNDVLPVPVVSPEGLVVLKLFAWRDRHRTEPRKDAADLAYVLRHYGDVLGEAVLFDSYPEVVEEADYDLELAAARVMGRKIASACQGATRVLVERLLAAELDAGEDSELLREMTAALALRDRAHATDLVRALHRGLEDPRHLEEEDGDRNP